MVHLRSDWSRRVGALVLMLGLGLPVWTGASESESGPGPDWKIAAERRDDDFAWQVYEEAAPVAGRPTFRIEAQFDVPPPIAASTLLQSMSKQDATMKGMRREVLEQREDGAVIHTFIDLPFMFDDRELAIDVRHRDDPGTGVHRIEWAEVNDRLPPPASGVLRLDSSGYWEFRPAEGEGTTATYVSRAEVGGSLPAAIGDRMMRGQAEDAVKRLRRLLAERALTNVAAPPPAD